MKLAVNFSIDKEDLDRVMAIAEKKFNLTEEQKNSMTILMNLILTKFIEDNNKEATK